MSLLVKEAILERLGRDDTSAIRIQPLLEEDQVGEVTVDLRLGYDFLVSVMTRKPYVSIDAAELGFRDIGSYFNVTRRDIGDKFIVYPNQVVLANTLEYVSLPSDCYADILSRSSYTRLGIHVNTMVQPGYRGSFGVELFNHGNNPIELIVGSRLFQVRFFELGEHRTYIGEGTRKYLGNVRPTASKASEDREHRKLGEIRDARA